MRVVRVVDVEINMLEGFVKPMFRMNIHGMSKNGVDTYMSDIYVDS